MRTEARTAQLPNPIFNTDTQKIAAEVGVALFDGGVGNVGPERVTCVIRNVGTFDVASAIERKVDGTQAQGIKGFNPPSLLSVGAGAPYFHQGAAATLEELFDPRFAAHHQAGNVNFLVNGGTTTFLLAEFVAHKRIRVITNSLMMAHAIDGLKQGKLGAEVHLTGGVLEPQSGLGEVVVLLLSLGAEGGELVG